MYRSPLLVALWGCLSMPALAADADEWMSRFIEAEHRRSYSGTFVYEKDGNLSTHAVWQVAHDGVLRERILQLDGEPVELVQGNGHSACMSDEVPAPIGVLQLWQAVPFDLETLSRYYQFRLTGESRIAARPAVVLVIEARDQFRHSLELHLDRETALLLKSVVRDDQQLPLERLQFVSFDLSTASAEDFRPGEACKPVSHEPHSSVEQQAQWRLDWLPPGFRLLASETRPDPLSGVPVAWFGYGDGVARFSIFLEPLNEQAADSMSRQIGSTVAVSHRISTQDGGVMATVLGDIPLGAAERVAWSMRYTGGIGR
ncbi:RNA polymerase subunit sigma [Stutzerimonas kirkiae]|nr:RNA polymerase subunit sigma [Stutzerimonas kirkiae]